MINNSNNKNKLFSIVISAFLILVTFFIGISVGKSGQTDTQNTTTSSTTITNAQVNELLQNGCITAAQVEADNDRSLQPIGTDDTSLSLARQEKVVQMNVTISQCKSKYPIN